MLKHPSLEQCCLHHLLWHQKTYSKLTWLIPKPEACMHYHTLCQIHVFPVVWFFFFWLPRWYWQHLQKAREVFPQQRLLFVCILVFQQEQFFRFVLWGAKQHKFQGALAHNSFLLQWPTVNQSSSAFMPSGCAARNTCAGWVHSRSSLGTGSATIQSPNFTFPDPSKVPAAEKRYQFSSLCCFHF